MTATRRSALTAVRAAVLAVLGLLVTARASRAGCNLIPASPKHFRAALGGTDRPFVGPGEIIRLGVLPTVCDQESPGFTSANPADYVVTVVFTPPGDASRRASVVVLAADCAAMADDVHRCGVRADVASVTCIDASKGDARRVEMLEHEGEPVLGVRFPDTDALVDEPTDGRTLTGPAAMAVTAAGAPLPCGLASARCADSTALPGLIVCADELFPQDGTCGTARSDVDPTLGHLTVLPPMNDYRTILALSRSEPAGPCTGPAAEIHMTVDEAGNALVPIDWRADSTDPGGETRPGKLYASETVRALLALAGPITLPGRFFLGSYTPGGTLLPLIFNLQTTSPDVSLFGSTDVPFTVLRLARRSATFRQCVAGMHDALPCLGSDDCPGGTCGAATCTGGAGAGTPCTSDRECAGGECGPALFDFRRRLLAGVGPVVIPEPAQSTAVALGSAVP